MHGTRGFLLDIYREYLELVPFEMNAYKLKDFCRHIYREYFELVHAYKMNVYNHTESAVTCFENILGVKIRHTLLIN